jgi:4-hydroxybenzoate polyprenyltransferase
MPDPVRAEDTTRFAAPPRWRACLTALRPHQWAKNALLFVPLVMGHELGNRGKLVAVAICFAAYSLLASGTYVVNDLVDLEADRAHPTKRRRPFASGQLGVGTGVGLAMACVAAAFSISLFALPVLASAMLCGYALLTMAYSAYLKRKVMLDVITLATLYTARILTGGVAAGVPISEWLLAFSIFLFLSLALAKRYTELSAVPIGEEDRIPGRGYWARDLDMVRTLGASSGSLAVLVLVLYINLSPEVARHYPHPWVLYLVCAVMFYWISRIWFLAQRGQLHHDPVVFALRDRVSLLAGGVTVALFVIATLRIPGLGS